MRICSHANNRFLCVTFPISRSSLIKLLSCFCRLQCERRIPTERKTNFLRFRISIRKRRPFAPNSLQICLGLKAIFQANSFPEELKRFSMENSTSKNLPFARANFSLALKEINLFLCSLSLFALSQDLLSTIRFICRLVVDHHRSASNRHLAIFTLARCQGRQAAAVKETREGIGRPLISSI